MVIAARCLEETFSMIGEEEAKHIEGAERFKYLVRLLNRSDEYWLEVLHNIRKSRHVWGRLRKLLWREGAEPEVSENFYHEVVQAVLLFGAKTWVLTFTMMQRLEVVHVSFLWQVTRKQATR